MLKRTKQQGLAANTLHGTSAPSTPCRQDGLRNSWLLWESLRNPSMKSTSEKRTVVTQPLPLPLGAIAIRQFEIQAEEILPSLPQIWQGRKILPP